RRAFRAAFSIAKNAASGASGKVTTSAMPASSAHRASELEGLAVARTTGAELCSRSAASWEPASEPASCTSTSTSANSGSSVATSSKPSICRRSASTAAAASPLPARPTRRLGCSVAICVLEQRHGGGRGRVLVGCVRRRAKEQRPVGVLLEPEETLGLRAGDPKLDRGGSVVAGARLRRGCDDEQVAQQDGAVVVLGRLGNLPRADHVDAVALLEGASEQLIRITGQLDDAVRALERCEHALLLRRAEAGGDEQLVLVGRLDGDQRGDLVHIRDRALRDVGSLVRLRDDPAPRGERAAGCADRNVAGRHQNGDGAGARALRVLL